MFDQSDFTPFEGRSLAVPELTMSRGDIIYEDGSVAGEEGRGEFLAQPDP
jgi:dihydroorotase-like cyclic amidohydrolase